MSAMPGIRRTWTASGRRWLTKTLSVCRQGDHRRPTAHSGENEAQHRQCVAAMKQDKIDAEEALNALHGKAAEALREEIVTGT